MPLSFFDKIDYGTTRANACEDYLYLYGISSRLGGRKYSAIKLKNNKFEINNTNKSQTKNKFINTAITIAKIISYITVLPFLIAFFMRYEQRKNIILNESNPQIAQIPSSTFPVTIPSKQILEQPITQLSLPMICETISVTKNQSIKLLANDNLNTIFSYLTREEQISVTLVSKDWLGECIFGACNVSFEQTQAYTQKLVFKMQFCPKIATKLNELKIDEIRSCKTLKELNTTLISIRDSIANHLVGLYKEFLLEDRNRVQQMHNEDEEQPDPEVEALKRFKNILTDLSKITQIPSIFKNIPDLVLLGQKLDTYLEPAARPNLHLDRNNYFPRLTWYFKDDIFDTKGFGFIISRLDLLSENDERADIILSDCIAYLNSKSCVTDWIVERINRCGEFCRTVGTFFLENQEKYAEKTFQFMEVLNYAALKVNKNNPDSHKELFKVLEVMKLQFENRYFYYSYTLNILNSIVETIASTQREDLLIKMAKKIPFLINITEKLINIERFDLVLKLIKSSDFTLEHRWHSIRIYIQYLITNMGKEAAYKLSNELSLNDERVNEIHYIIGLQLYDDGKLQEAYEVFETINDDAVKANLLKHMHKIARKRKDFAEIIAIAQKMPTPKMRSRAYWNVINSLPSIIDAQQTETLKSIAEEYLSVMHHDHTFFSNHPEALLELLSRLQNEGQYDFVTSLLGTQIIEEDLEYPAFSLFKIIQNQNNDNHTLLIQSLITQLFEDFSVDIITYLGAQNDTGLARTFLDNGIERRRVNSRKFYQLLIKEFRKNGRNDLADELTEIYSEDPIIN